MSTMPGLHEADRPSCEPPLYRKILVAVNGSVSSRMALSAGVMLARHSRGTITIVGVSPLVPWQVGYAGLPSGLLQDDSDEHMRRTLDRALLGVPWDVAATTTMRRGRVARTILVVAEEGDHDVIVLGARGAKPRGGGLGGVGRNVQRHSSIPVFVTQRPTGSPGGGDEPEEGFDGHVLRGT